MHRPRARPAVFAFAGLALAVASLAPAARGDDLPAEAVLATLPFEASDEPNRIYVDLAPEGRRPLVLLLDTGATETVVTPRAARALGVSVRRDKQSPHRRATRLGRDLEFWVDTRSSDTGARTAFEYGLLGGSFLADYVVDIDFGGRQVRFLDPRRYEVPATATGPGEQVLPLRVVANRPTLEVAIGERSIPLLLDTGAPIPLVLSGAAAKRVGLDARRWPEIGSAATVLGPMALRLGETPRLTIGRESFGPVSVLVAPRGWYNQGGGNDSVIGFELLSRFHVRLDYPRRRLWLRRTSSEAAVGLRGVD